MLVLTSLEETAPMCIAEAMAVGLPVVSPRISGIPQMVRENESAFLVDSGNQDGLNRCILKLASDPDLRTYMGRCGKSIASKKWDPQTVAEQTYNVYKSVIANGAM
jgi:glycosyltransferase involved in cell wall biosynthesis